MPIYVENSLQIFGVVWNRQPIGAQGFPGAKTVGGGSEMVRILMIGDERNQAACWKGAGQLRVAGMRRRQSCESCFVFAAVSLSGALLL